MKKVILFIIYLIIIISIPLFLDYLFQISVRKKRKENIKKLAKERAEKLNKSLIVINNRYYGFVNNRQTQEKFTGDIEDIVQHLSTNSCVIILSSTLEYIDHPKKFLRNIKRVSGGNFYLVNIEKNSPRVFWDYKIKNVVEKSFYLPKSIRTIEWSKPSDLQQKTQQFYQKIFQILPYHFFVNDSLQKI